MQFVVALSVLAVAAGFAVVYWRTSPRHRRVVAAARLDRGELARRAREGAHTPRHG
ncbi:hypothetical protein [Kineococcus gypseus]|uniref:hypothetical protein n=1 Tax=Kineococcus gypseus TaxID=1637102 RepID=UPI003D7E0433